MNHARTASGWHRILSSFGLPSRQASTSPAAFQQKLHIVVDFPGQGPGRVGTLTVEGDEFVFRYDDAFIRKPAVQPLMGFPDLGREYRSKELWAFFKARIPPLDREDVRLQLQSSHVKVSDTLKVLATVAHRAIASPYVFDLER